jgi:hypothetical protein
MPEATTPRPISEIIEELQAYAAEQLALPDGEILLAKLCIETASRLYELHNSTTIWRNAANRMYELTRGTDA